MLKFIAEVIEAVRIRRLVNEDMRLGRPYDLMASMGEALRKFPEQRLVQEIEAEAELYRRALLKRRLHDA